MFMILRKPSHFAKASLLWLTYNRNWNFLTLDENLECFHTVATQFQMSKTPHRYFVTAANQVTIFEVFFWNIYKHHSEILFIDTKKCFTLVDFSDTISHDISPCFQNDRKDQDSVFFSILDNEIWNNIKYEIKWNETKQNCTYSLGIPSKAVQHLMRVMVNSKKPNVHGDRNVFLYSNSLVPTFSGFKLKMEWNVSINSANQNVLYENHSSSVINPTFCLSFFPIFPREIWTCGQESIAINKILLQWIWLRCLCFCLTVLMVTK